MTWVFHSFTVYPDGVGAVLVLTGVWALYRADAETRSADERVWPWLLHGAALAALPWLHTRFSVLAGGLGALVLLRLSGVSNPAAKAFVFLSVPSVSFIAWLGSFIAIYGTANPAAPYGGEAGGLEFVPDGLAGLLFDQGFGLVAYAPVLLCAFAGIGIMLGLGGALALQRVMSGMLYGVEPTDPLTFAVVAVSMLALFALAAFALPIWIAKLVP